MSRFDRATTAFLTLCLVASAGVAAQPLLVGAQSSQEKAVVLHNPGTTSAAPAGTAANQTAVSIQEERARLETVMTRGGVAVAVPAPTQLGVELARGETARSIRYEDWPLALLIARYFPESPYRWVRTATCESGLDPRAVGEGKYLGLLQVDPGHLNAPDVIAALGGLFPPEALFEPEINVRVARVLYLRRPDGADWPITRSGCAAWSAARS